MTIHNYQGKEWQIYEIMDALGLNYRNCNSIIHTESSIIIPTSTGTKEFKFGDMITIENGEVREGE